MQTDPQAVSGQEETVSGDGSKEDLAENQYSLLTILSEDEDNDDNARGGEDKTKLKLGGLSLHGRETTAGGGAKLSGTLKNAIINTKANACPMVRTCAQPAARPPTQPKIFLYHLIYGRERVSGGWAGERAGG